MVHCVYTFSGALDLTEYCPVQNSLNVQVLRSPILAALLHGIQQQASAKLCGVLQRTRNGITELSQRVVRHLYSAGGHHVGHRPTF